MNGQAVNLVELFALEQILIQQQNIQQYLYQNQQYNQTCSYIQGQYYPLNPYQYQHQPGQPPFLYMGVPKQYYQGQQQNSSSKDKDDKQLASCQGIVDLKINTEIPESMPIKQKVRQQKKKKVSQQKFKIDAIKVENTRTNTQTYPQLPTNSDINLPQQQQYKEYNQEQKILLEQSDSSYKLSQSPDNNNDSEDKQNDKRVQKLVKPQKQISKMSKNIPKNIFKGMIKYILGKKEEINTYFHGDQEKVCGFIKYIKVCKNSVLSMQQMKNFLLSTKNEEYTKLSRILSYQFVDKHYIAYIYNSKIKCRREHLANKRKFIQILCNNPACQQKKIDQKL